MATSGAVVGEITNRQCEPVLIQDQSRTAFNGNKIGRRNTNGVIEQKTRFVFALGTKASS